MLGATQRPDGWWTVYFDFAHNSVTHRDSVTLSPIEYVSMTESQIKELRQERFAAWVTSLVK